MQDGASVIRSKELSRKSQFEGYLGFVWEVQGLAGSQVISDVQLGVFQLLTAQSRDESESGAINPEAQSCIASFPGKYSELWDDAVAIALEKHDVCSLACVFLTDTASGQLDGLLEDVSWLVYVRVFCFWKGSRPFREVPANCSVYISALIIDKKSIWPTGLCKQDVVPP